MSMKVFFDIGHPAHVHYFKNTIISILKNGGKVFISARDRYPVNELLGALGLPFYNRGKGSDSIIGKLIYIVKADWTLYGKAKLFAPDILIGFGSPYIAHVSRLLRKPSIIVDDTDNAVLSHKLYKPFATYILTPSMFSHDFGRKHHRFDGYMELAYLHPKYFSPDVNVLKEVGVEPGEIFTILRFVGWNANHDIGHNGINSENKVRAVERFLQFGKVFITSESGVPNQIQKHIIKIAPDRLHDLMAYSSLLFGESATMASESAMLGVPAIYLDNDGRCYTDDLEKKYGIVKNFKESSYDQAQSIEYGEEILQNRNTILYMDIRDRIVEEKVCFTDYLNDFLSNFFGNTLL